MRKLLEYLKHLGIESLEFRDDYATIDKRAKSVKTVTIAVFIYSMLAPFLVINLLKPNAKWVVIEFITLWLVSVITACTWKVLSRLKRYVGEGAAVRRGRLLQHLTWFLVSGLFGWTMLASYINVKVENHEPNAMPWLIVAMLIAVGVTLNPFEVVLFNSVSFILVFGQIITMGATFSDSIVVYNYVIFDLILMGFSMNKYFLMLRDFRREKEIEGVHKERERFLVSMTHEMRTPLTAVLGKNEIICNDTKEVETKALSEEIQASGKFLLSLINDLLDFSKMESGKMSVKPIEYDTYEISYEIAEIMRSEAINKGLEFRLDVSENIPKRLMGDDVRIRQIIMNLVSNAIKYTDKGHVSLRISFDYSDKEKREGKLLVVVSDTGMGIKEEDIPKLTKAFSRVNEERTRAVKGTGLGLAITAQLLTLMGSELMIESTYGEGSRFSFVLKQKVISEEVLTDSPRKHADKKPFYVDNARVLVVDDNKVNFSVCKGLLKYYNIQPDYAESGARCLEMLEENSYDLVFMDHLMPDMSGVDTLDAIKEKMPERAENMKIIALTANESTSSEAEYKAYGFDGYLGKPIDSSALYDIMFDVYGK